MDSFWRELTDIDIIFNYIKIKYYVIHAHISYFYKIMDDIHARRANWNIEPCRYFNFLFN